jgi:hypothetical protein
VAHCSSDGFKEPNTVIAKTQDVRARVPSHVEDKPRVLLNPPATGVIREVRNHHLRDPD